MKPKGPKSRFMNMVFGEFVAADLEAGTGKSVGLDVPAGPFVGTKDPASGPGLDLALAGLAGIVVLGGVRTGAERLRALRARAAVLADSEGIDPTLAPVERSMAVTRILEWQKALVEIDRLLGACCSGDAPS